MFPAVRSSIHPLPSSPSAPAEHITPAPQSGDCPARAKADYVTICLADQLENAAPAAIDRLAEHLERTRLATGGIRRVEFVIMDDAERLKLKRENERIHKLPTAELERLHAARASLSPDERPFVSFHLAQRKSGEAAFPYIREALAEMRYPNYRSQYHHFAAERGEGDVMDHYFLAHLLSNDDFVKDRIVDKMMALEQRRRAATRAEQTGVDQEDASAQTHGRAESHDGDGGLSMKSASSYLTASPDLSRCNSPSEAAQSAGPAAMFTPPESPASSTGPSRETSPDRSASDTASSANDADDEASYSDTESQSSIFRVAATRLARSNRALLRLERGEAELQGDRADPAAAVSHFIAARKHAAAAHDDQLADYASLRLTQLGYRPIQNAYRVIFGDVDGEKTARAHLALIENGHGSAAQHVRAAARSARRAKTQARVRAIAEALNIGL